jgi:hypothetical protein
MDDSDISGSNGRRVQVRAARGSRKAAPRRNGFTEAKRRKFLAHFAATCNAKGAARAAGVAHSTIYAWRKKDEPFRIAWNESLEQGYARLEAELVRRATQSLRVSADEKAAADHAIVDPATALKVLESYRRNGDRRPGEILAGPYDLEKVRARLEAKMRALRKARGGEGPSTMQSSLHGPPPQPRSRGDREEQS